jgi:hypothetical protein
MFEHYNLVDPMEQGAVIIKVELQEGSLKILQLLPQVFIL